MSELIGAVAGFIRRFVVMDEGKLLVVALWVIHTHCFSLFPQTPYLAVTSPEKQCGKSRLLEVLQLLVAKAWYAVLPSDAVVYRVIESRSPTLLLDEVDTIFNARTMDHYEGLRAMLNAGHRKGAKVPRCIGQSAEIAEFSVFCPKVLAGIGTLPDTVADRSIPIRMERRSDEPIEKFKLRDVDAPATDLQDAIKTWCYDHAAVLTDARPEMPEELSDREQEGCEPLVAIADELGCGAETRLALVRLLGAEREDTDSSLRLKLLEDLRLVFEAHPEAPAAYTTSLLKELKALDESPWASYFGREFTDRDIATLLKPYRIHSKKIWDENRTVQHRGYRRDDLWPVWERYLPSP